MLTEGSFLPDPRLARWFDGLAMLHAFSFERGRVGYAFGVGLRGPNSRFVDQLVKADVRRGEALTWHDPGTFPGEPIFVRRPGGRRDDDGVVLSVLLDAGRRSSALVVLDARTMEEVARASVPHHIPFGFHGVYAR